MSIGNLAQLLIAIPSWANRVGHTEFAASVPLFIAGCEQQMNYGLGDQPALRIADMEKAATIPMVNGEGDLPDDYLQWRGVTKGALPNDLLELGSLAGNQFLYGQDASGVSREIDIVGSKIHSAPASSASLTIRYYAKIPALTEDAPTNWLLAKAPMIYLYGSLMHSAPFLQDDDRTAMWAQLYAGHLGGLINSDKSARFSRMRSRVLGPTP